MSNSIVEIEDTKCVFIFGYNASTSHPIVARRINHAKAKGAKVIVCDPRKIETARIADIYAPLANGSNVAFLNAMMNVILEEGLQDQTFIDEHTENFDAFYETVKAYTPESTQHITVLSLKCCVKLPALMRKRKPLLSYGVWAFANSVKV